MTSRVFAMISVSLRQLLGRRRIITFAILGLVPAVVFYLAAANESSSEIFDLYHEFALPPLFVLSGITAIILGASALGDERRDQTLSFLVVRPMPRWAIAVSKLAAALVTSCAVASYFGLLTAAATASRSGDWSIVLPTVVGLAVSAGCYAAVFMVLGYATSRAVLIGLVYLFVWENVANAAAAMANLSLYRIGITAYAGLLPEARSLVSEPLADLAPGLWGAVVKLVAIAAVCVLAAATMLRRRDIT